MTFRLRLLLTSLATLAVGLGVLLVAGNLLLQRGVRSEATALLRARADAQLAALKVNGDRLAVREPANDAAIDRLAWVMQGSKAVARPSSTSPALDRVAVALGRRRAVSELDAPGDIRLRAQPVHAAGAAVPIGAVVVGLSVAPLERLQQEILVGSLIVAALVLLAGGLAVRSALDGALRPVAQMTASAEDWGAHDLDRRFALGPPRDELTGLASTLDGLLSRIAASRRHEQRFAGDVAHELRTPVAGLRGRAELALGAEGADAGEQRRQALEAVVAQSDRLDRTIDPLLAVARQELDPTADAVDLAALAGEFEDVRVTSPAGLPHAEGEPEVLRRVVSALVDNARRHAAGHVWIELSGAGDRVRLAVRDDGPGLDPALAERAFQPGVRGPGERDGGDPRGRVRHLVCVRAHALDPLDRDDAPGGVLAGWRSCSRSRWAPPRATSAPRSSTLATPSRSASSAR